MPRGCVSDAAPEARTREAEARTREAEADDQTLARGAVASEHLLPAALVEAPSSAAAAAAADPDDGLGGSDPDEDDVVLFALLEDNDDGGALSDSLGEEDLADFAGPDARGRYSATVTPEDDDERRHLDALASRKPGDVWAMYQQGTGLPRSYAMLLAPDARLRVNDRPARWRVAYLSARDRADWRARGRRGDGGGGESPGGAGVFWQTEGDSEVWGCKDGYWSGWVLGACLDREFSHPASVSAAAADEIVDAARRHARRFFNRHRVLWRPGDDLLIPNRPLRSKFLNPPGDRTLATPAAVVVPRVGQVWTMTWLRKKTSSSDAYGTRARKLGATEKKKRRRVVAPDGETLHLVPEDIVVVREVRTEDEASMPASVANAPGAWVREGWRLSAATFTVERLEETPTPAAAEDEEQGERTEETASSRRFAATGERFDGCWFQDFDYQVPVFERALSGVPENASESGRREVLRLDALALEVMLEDGYDAFSDLDSEEEEGGGTKNTKGERAAKMMKREKPVKPPRKICRPPKRVSSPTPSRSIEKYPRCEGCGETEWHFSSAAPGEPDLGAPVVIRCDDASCASRFGGGSSRSRACWWHPQCIAPGHVPGDAHVALRLALRSEPSSRDRALWFLCASPTSPTPTRGEPASAAPSRGSSANGTAPNISARLGGRCSSRARGKPRRRGLILISARGSPRSAG